MKRSIVLSLILFALLSSCDNSTSDNEFVKEYKITTKGLPDLHGDESVLSKKRDKDSLITDFEPKPEFNTENWQPSGELSCDPSFDAFYNYTVKLSLENGIWVGYLFKDLERDSWFEMEFITNNFYNNYVTNTGHSDCYNFKNLKVECKNGVTIFKLIPENVNPFLEPLKIKYIDNKDTKFHKGGYWIAGKKRNYVTIVFEKQQ